MSLEPKWHDGSVISLTYVPANMYKKQAGADLVQLIKSYESRESIFAYDEGRNASMRPAGLASIWTTLKQ